MIEDDPARTAWNLLSNGFWFFRREKRGLWNVCDLRHSVDTVLMLDKRQRFFFDWDCASETVFVMPL
jgi:hypothetical protein